MVFERVFCEVDQQMLIVNMPFTEQRPFTERLLDTPDAQLNVLDTWLIALDA